MTLYRDADRFRRALLRHESQAANEMVQAYGQAWRSIKKRLDELLKKMQVERAAGRDVSLSWLFEQQRLETLQRQVEAELRRWAADAEPRIIALQREAIEAAQLQAEAETMVALGTPPPGVTIAPSCVTVNEMGEKHRRIHHCIEWRSAVPCIVSEKYRKT